MNVRLACNVVTIALISSACGHASPLAPGVSGGESARLSGWVYMHYGPEDPPIADAGIEITTADGTVQRVLTDADGYYEVVLGRGAISIKASKEGYEPKTWELKLLEDTVLNFGLVPK